MGLPVTVLYSDFSMILGLMVWNASWEKHGYDLRAAGSRTVCPTTRHLHSLKEASGLNYGF